MRISTNIIFETGVSQLGTLQSQLAKTQQQLATNRRILTPADDPIAAARALEVTQAQSLNTQFSVNRQNARSSMMQVESVLSGATSLLQDVRALTISAGNGAYAQADREVIAGELEGRLDDLMGLANSTDATGGFLFGGYRSATAPFTKSANGADYQGDQGQRLVQAGASRYLPVSEPGSAVFEANPTGNGTFETVADAGNVTRGGSGVISGGSVTNAASLTRDTYTLAFSVTGGSTTYTITNSAGQTLPPAPATPDLPYQSGQAISFDGITFDITGVPVAGDVFTVSPSRKQSVFETLSNLITALRTPIGDLAGKASLSNELAEANNNLRSSLDTVLGVRTSVGARLKELDYLDGTGEDLNIQYSGVLSNLQDLDMVKAISSYTQQQYTLEAAQKSFKSLSGLSLFNFIG